MVRIEYNNNDGQCNFLYVTDEVRISTDDLTSFNLESKDGGTVQIHNVWTYLDATKDALFELNLLTQHTDEVLNAIQVLRACGR